MRTFVLGGAAMGLIGIGAALALREGLETTPIRAQQPLPGQSFDSRLFGQPPPAARGVEPTSNASRPAPSRYAIDETLFDEGYTAEERNNIAVYESCNRGVVNINTKMVSERLLFDIPSEGAGSGIVVDQAGHILTNFHVVEGAKEIQVTLFDGNNYPAKLVGKDVISDVAVLKIDAQADVLHPVPFGESTQLRVGQRVFAIGNPFGLERTLTIGIISSLNRTLPSRTGRAMKSMIQIDAAINPGNSGGPVLNTHGLLIGMNTAIASKNGQNSGVGFAIPVNTLSRVVPQLIENGQVVRPEVGIARVYQTEKGLVIASLVRGGPAEQSGLRGPRLVQEAKRQGLFNVESRRLDMNTADRITAVNREPIKTADDFLSAIETEQPGREVVITVVREGRSLDIAVRLGVSRD